MGKAGKFYKSRYSGSTLLIHWLAFAMNRRMPLSFKNLLDESIKISHFIAFQPLSACLFNLMK